MSESRTGCLTRGVRISDMSQKPAPKWPAAGHSRTAGGPRPQPIFTAGITCLDPREVDTTWPRTARRSAAATRDSPLMSDARVIVPPKRGKAATRPPEHAPRVDSSIFRTMPRRGPTALGSHCIVDAVRLATTTTAVLRIRSRACQSARALCGINAPVPPASGAFGRDRLGPFVREVRCRRGGAGRCRNRRRCRRCRRCRCPCSRCLCAPSRGSRRWSGRRSRRSASRRSCSPSDGARR
jgi:hypothetical protein